MPDTFGGAVSQRNLRGTTAQTSERCVPGGVREPLAPGRPGMVHREPTLGPEIVCKDTTTNRMTRKILNQAGHCIGTSSRSPRPQHQQNWEDNPDHFLACLSKKTQDRGGQPHRSLLRTTRFWETRQPSSLVECRCENVALARLGDESRRCELKDQHGLTRNDGGITGCG